jgi:hypothetical protein
MTDSIPEEKRLGPDPGIPCDMWDSRCEQFRRQRNEARETIKSLVMDNKALTNALQRIEAGELDPLEIAKTVLDRPSWGHLYE